MKTFFGVSWSPDLVLKLLALVFALGVLVQRVDSQAVLLQTKMETARELATTRFDDLQQRLNRVENKLDKLP